MYRDKLPNWKPIKVQNASNEVFVLQQTLLTKHTKRQSLFFLIKWRKFVIYRNPATRQANQTDSDEASQTGIYPCMTVKTHLITSEVPLRYGQLVFRHVVNAVSRGERHNGCPAKTSLTLLYLYTNIVDPECRQGKSSIITVVLVNVLFITGCHKIIIVYVLIPRTNESYKFPIVTSFWQKKCNLKMLGLYLLGQNLHFNHI